MEWKKKLPCFYLLVILLIQDCLNIYVPAENYDKNILRNLGIKSLGWQDPDGQSVVTVHHKNYNNVSSQNERIDTTTQKISPATDFSYRMLPRLLTLYMLRNMTTTARYDDLEEQTEQYPKPNQRNSRDEELSELEDLGQIPYDSEELDQERKRTPAGNRGRSDPRDNSLENERDREVVQDFEFVKGKRPVVYRRGRTHLNTTGQNSSRRTTPSPAVYDHNPSEEHPNTEYLGTQNSQTYCRYIRCNSPKRIHAVMKAESRNKNFSSTFEEELKKEMIPDENNEDLEISGSTVYDAVIKKIPTPHEKCPKMATGQFVYAFSCNQFLNCWKGRGFVQNCAPGTLFNPKTLECDYANKVKCITSPRKTAEKASRNEKLQISCPIGFFGIIPHRNDCSKFVNCANGVETESSCPPGTLFSVKINNCDHSWKAQCASWTSSVQNNYQQQNRSLFGTYFGNQRQHVENLQVSCPVGFSGIIPYHNDCSKFINCANGVETISSCPPGTLFSVKINNCDHSWKVKCANWTSSVQNIHQPANRSLFGTYFGNQGQHVDYRFHPGYINQFALHRRYHPQSGSVRNVTRVSCQNGKCGDFGYSQQGYGTQYFSASGHPGVYTPHTQFISFADHNRGQTSPGKAQSKKTPTCPDGAVGVHPHPYDCSKFLNCANGQTFIQDCGPGTLFNPLIRVCDHPYNVKCTVTNEETEETRNSDTSSEKPPSLPTWHGSNFAQSTDYWHKTGGNNNNNGAFINSYACQIYGGVYCTGGRHNHTSSTTSQQSHTHGIYDGSTRPFQSWNRNNNGFRTVYQNKPEDNQTAIHTPNRHDFLHNHTYHRHHYYYYPPYHTFHHNHRHQTNPPDYHIHHQNPNIQYNEEEYSRTNYTDVNEGKGNRPNESDWFPPYLPTNVNPESEERGNKPKNTDWPPPLPSSDVNPESEERDNKPKNTDWPPPFPSTDVNSESERRSNKPKTSDWPPPFPSTDTNADYFFESEETTQPLPLDTFNTRRNHSCSPKPFWCTEEECVPISMVCDGSKDCDNGKDERNCERYLVGFELIPEMKLGVRPKEIFSNTTLFNCAKLCTEVEGFICKSFCHRKTKDGACLLMDTNIGLSGALIPSSTYDYYEATKYTLDCSNKHICKNKKCINDTQICDGVNDCGDRADEKGCKAEDLDYEVRIVGTENPYEGRIEVKVFGKWGYICDDKFGLRDADVVCKEVGFPMGALEVRTNSFYAQDVDNNDTFYLMDDVSCLGNETTLRDCDFNGWGIHNCEPQEIVGVICKTPQEKCPKDFWQCDTGNECLPLTFLCDGVSDCKDRSDEGSQHCEAPLELRLSGGKSNKEGRVEIRYHGTWGTVCDDDFNDDAAKVVCKYLGYYGGATAMKDGYFGAGEGPIWLDQVFCQGNESRIEECSHWNWGEHNCEHSEDVGVICSSYDISGSERSAKLDDEVLTNFLPESVLPERCGYRNDDLFLENDSIHARVVQGSKARRGDYPWQASIRVKNKLKPSHWCGAVIISQKFLLTAAHCLDGFSKGSYFVVAGDYNIDIPEGTEQEAFIEDFYVHEQFREGQKMNNDIALIKLKGRGFILTKDVQPICLPKEDTEYIPYMNCTISGFGSVQSGKSTYSHELRAAWLPLQPFGACRMPHVYGSAITDGMICAGSLDEGVDACDGDSGGPLACLHKGYFTLYGITSWGQRCGQANKPGVYVKVAYYREWIENIMKNHHV